MKGHWICLATWNVHVFIHSDGNSSRKTETSAFTFITSTATRRWTSSRGVGSIVTWCRRKDVSRVLDWLLVSLCKFRANNQPPVDLICITPLIMNEFQCSLRHSIAIEELYKKSFEFEPIGQTVRPEIDEKWAREWAPSLNAWIIRPNASSDRIGLKRSSIELTKGFRIVSSSKSTNQGESSGVIFCQPVCNFAPEFMQISSRMVGRIETDSKDLRQMTSLATERHLFHWNASTASGIAAH